MSLTRPRLFVVCCALLAIAPLTGYLWSAFAGKREFSSLAEFRTWAHSQGLIIWGDSGNTLSVTDDPSRAGTAPVGRPVPWRNVVIVCHSCPITESITPPDGVGVSYWGEVMAYGCPDLLARIDALR